MSSKSTYQKSLRACIIESLRQGEMSPDLEAALLAQNRSQVNQKDETEYWDYKEDIDLDNPIKVAQLAKWVLGFHNSKGGAIIVGVANDFRVTGIYESRVTDTVRLRDKIKKYTGPDIGLFQGRIQTANSGKLYGSFLFPSIQSLQFLL